VKVATDTKKPIEAQPADAAELDRAWPRLRIDEKSAAYRARMPTPHDENPLRHDVPQSGARDKYRDKQPTLPEIDPLRYDLEP
jgi:hypothetical protein